MKKFFLLALLFLAACEDEAPGPGPGPDPIDTTIVDPVDTTIVDPIDTTEINQDILKKRDNTPGFVPSFIPTKHQKFFTEPTRIVMERSGKKVINRRDYSSWDATGIANGGDFLIEPGNYKDWGVLELDKSGGSLTASDWEGVGPNLKMTVTMPPIRLNNVHDWTFQGFTVDGAGFSKTPGIMWGNNKIGTPICNNIHVKGCIVQEIEGPAIAISGSNNLVEDNIVRFRADVDGDLGGIPISVPTGEIVYFNTIRRNEIYNVTDCVGVTYNANGRAGEARGTIIEDNDCYVTKEMYIEDVIGGAPATLAKVEDGFDTKNGSKDPDHKYKSYLRYNRFWGFRPCPQEYCGGGSGGVGIISHREARNWEIHDNIFFDLTAGAVIKDESKPGEKVDNIHIYNNLFFGLVDAMPRTVRNDGTVLDNPGSALFLSNMCSTCSFEQNTVIGAKRLLETKASVTASYSCNVFIADEQFLEPGNLNASDGTYDTFSFYVKRWTGPELITLQAGPTQAKQPKLNNCN